VHGVGPANWAAQLASWVADTEYLAVSRNATPLSRTTRDTTRETLMRAGTPPVHVQNWGAPPSGPLSAMAQTFPYPAGQSANSLPPWPSSSAGPATQAGAPVYPQRTLPFQLGFPSPDPAFDSFPAPRQLAPGVSTQQPPAPDKPRARTPRYDPSLGDSSTGQGINTGVKGVRR